MNKDKIKKLLQDKLEPPFWDSDLDIIHEVYVNEIKEMIEKITKDILDEIEQYIVSAKAIKINKQQADFVYWYDIKLAIKRLLSNLSPNKENKNNG